MNPNRNRFINLPLIKQRSNKKNIKIKLLEAKRIPGSKKIFFNQHFPQKDSIPIFNFRRNSNNIEFEVEWLLEMLNITKNDIVEFLKLQDSYNTAYFKSDYEKCKQILENINFKFGISIWLIESHINLYKKIDHTYKQSEAYLDGIINSKISEYYKIISWILFMKSEDMVSPSRFEIELERSINSLSIIKKMNFQDYLLFKFSIGTELNELDFLSILQLQENLSIIDRYFTLATLIEYIFEDNFLNFNKTIIDKCMNVITFISGTESTIYHQIQNEKILLNNSRSSNLNNLKAIDEYSIGNYDNAIEICNLILKDRPYEIELYDILIKSLLSKGDIRELDDSNFYNELINLFMQFYKSKDTDDETVKKLLKISNDHLSNDWAWKMLSLTYVLKFGNKILESSPFIRKGFKNSKYIKPQIIPYIYNEANKKDLYISIVFAGSNITNKIHDAYASLDLKLIETLEIDKNRKYRLLANLHLLKANYTDALDYFDLIDSKNSQINYFEISIGKIQAYTALDEIDLTVNLIVDSYFSNTNLLLEIDIETISSKIMSSLSSSSNLKTLIFINLITKYINPTLFENKHDFLEDFLLEFKINLISELDISLFESDFQGLIYVLKEYCTIETMSKYYFFNRYEDVEEERIKICILLTEIDSDNQEIYNNEIKEITQTMQIREYSAALERSKIYVDIDGIKKQTSKKIEDNFNRIREYFNSARNKGEVLYFTYQGDDGNIAQIKGNRYSDIYNSLIHQIRDSFISSKEYGLDVYLSLGIRHGTIFGQLRKLFEKDNFMTLFVSNLNKYKKNTFWIDKMNIKNPLVIDEVDMAFQIFNQKIDEVLIYLKDHKLQITTDVNNDISLFNYHLSDFNLMVMFSEDIKDKNLSLDSFINNNIDKLWSITEGNLENVRNYLKIEYKNMILTEIDEFIKNIKQIEVSHQINLREFNQKMVDLKTDLSYQINKVSSWFTKEKVIEIDNFTIDLPVNIALEFVKSININTTIFETTNLNTKSLLIDGRYLKWFSEIFITIFDNIIKRSGMRNEIHFSLEISLNTDNKLVIVCRNPLHLSEIEISNRKQLLTAKLQEIKIISDTEESEIMSRASKEGGSGFYKIVKLLKYDIKSDKPTLNFDIENDEFYIEIILDTGRVAIESVSS
ncbi:hypothetical protein [Sporosarcina sp. BP05]|uniref:hypothetical protein n=1 Tax=Sporosarcina sp. BP05 TaxID=2758726 RepID=UPI00164627B6|nr:hypothetical protein [Sporosarcina sp. BP05]